MFTLKLFIPFCLLCSSSELKNYVLSKHYLKCFSKLRINQESLLTLYTADKLSIRLKNPGLKSLGKAIVESALLCMCNVMAFPLPLTDISKFYIIPQSLLAFSREEP